MADEALTYDFDALATAHDDITAAVRDFDRVHAAVTGLMDRLRKTWTDGKAAEAWYAYQSEWITVFGDVTDDLRRLGDAVDRSRQNALGAESANREIWNA